MQLKWPRELEGNTLTLYSPRVTRDVHVLLHWYHIPLNPSSTMKNPFKNTEAIQGVSAAPIEVSEKSSSPATNPQDMKDPTSEISTGGKTPVDFDASEVTKPDGLFSGDSPYEEVRAAVRNTDGEEVANTVRAWVLGMFFVTIGSALNMFLSMR
jgi:hypothetical protein